MEQTILIEMFSVVDTIDIDHIRLSRSKSQCLFASAALNGDVGGGRGQHDRADRGSVVLGSHIRPHELTLDVWRRWTCMALVKSALDVHTHRRGGGSQGCGREVAACRAARGSGQTQLEDINRTVQSTGDDPELDTLIIRFHEETAARRGGALALRPFDLDPQQCLVRLREKGETERWQPVSPTLMMRLVSHADERGTGDPYSQLLRYRRGAPITSRRYDYIWTRIGRHLPWVAVQQVSTHWIRHTVLRWVERNCGYAVARAFAGHNDRKDGGTTATYVRAELYEVAAALSALVGEPHPLAPTPQDRAGLPVSIGGTW